MKTNVKINVRAAIKDLEIGGLPLQLPKFNYIPSSVRSTAAIITGDTGRKFTVSVTDELITVTRNA